MRALRAVCLGATALLVASGAQGAAPPRPTGGLRFGPATLADPLGVVSSPVARVDGSGRIWVVGRPGAVLVSTDDGDSFRRTSPGAGTGAADVAVAGATVIVAAEEGGSVGVAASDDGGASWRRGSVEPGGPVTRPWLAVDGDTVFLAATTPAGTEILAASAADLAFGDAGAPGPEAFSTRCGRLVFDPVRRNLYLACARESAVEVTVGHVEPGRRSRIAFTTSVAAVSPAGQVGGLPSLAVDDAGDAYLVWVDASNSSLYAARPGSAPVSINGAGADVVALPVAVGGAAGTFGVAYLGAETDRDPNTLPDARTDPRGAAAVRWYGFAAVVTGLSSGTAGILQQRAIAKPVGFGRICTSCAADPVFGDSLGVGIEAATGALRIVLADASGPRHVPQPLLVRQLAGPTVRGQSISKPVPANGVIDGVDVPAAPQLDVTKLELQQVNPATLRVRMTLAGTSTLTPPPGAASAVWLARFQILSQGAAGEAAYRSLYAAAISTGGQPRFTGGEVVCDQACRPSSPRPASGHIEGNVLVIDLNIAALAAAIQIEGDLLYNVSGFTFAGDAAGNPSAVVDSLASFDYRLDQRIGPTTGRGRRIVVRGTIRGATTTVDVFENKTGRVGFRDLRTKATFRSTSITRVTVRGRTATISGSGRNGTRRVSFVATVVDRGRGRLDSFGLRLSSGYRKSGRLLTGNASIQGSPG